MANLDIVKDNKDSSDVDNYVSYDDALVGWIMNYVQQWEDHRDQNYAKNWDEYYRLWRGFWSENDKNRDSERSKLINPALSQAIDAAVSELEEATFGQDKWFDVVDNEEDEVPEDIAKIRTLLQEDADRTGTPAAVSEVFLSSALYGTGIGKIIIEEVEKKSVTTDLLGETEVGAMSLETEYGVDTKLIAVDPREFVIDTAAVSIDDALGCAHIFVSPKHIIETKQRKGIYEDCPLGGYDNTIVGNTTKQKHDLEDASNSDKVLIVEYHGLVPRAMLMPEVEDDEEVVELFEEDDAGYVDETDLVEAIVTIANGNTLLRAVENPYVMKDRCFIAFQYDTVPNEFWGRGVAEKGYNPQKALDAELRGRIDAMALTIHPMMAVDATRVTRGNNMKVAPGRQIFTNGDPRTALMPLTFGAINNNTFMQSGELERMVQMGTGSMDSASPLQNNRRNETSSGMGMIMAGAIKRSKRTLKNIERMFTKPLIHKMAWRYMQFDPNRYPVADVNFKVFSTLGMQARELEQQQIVGAMATVPPDSPAYWILLRSMFEYSNLKTRDQLLPMIERMMEQSLQAAEGPKDPMVALKMKEQELKEKLEMAKLQLEKQDSDRQAMMDVEKLKIELRKLDLQEQEMILDAKARLAEMEQDSQVTAAQMTQSGQNEKTRIAVDLVKEGMKQSKKSD